VACRKVGRAGREYVGQFRLVFALNYQPVGLLDGYP
jgi:hypothetical protein